MMLMMRALVRDLGDLGPEPLQMVLMMRALVRDLGDLRSALSFVIWVTWGLNPFANDAHD